MKLDTKRTVLVGFAFLAISAFWQMYDNLIPLMLSDTFKIKETYAGFIMSLDNILALFLLPLFGGLSDKCRSALGRRRPFILFGTLVSVALMILLPLLDNSYAASPALWKLVGFIAVLGLLLIAMGTYRSPAVALMPDVTPKPLRSKANAIINLMGAVGGVIYLLVSSVLYRQKPGELAAHINYLPLFSIVGGIMLGALAVIMFLVDEPKLAARQKEYEQAHPEDNLAEQTENGVTTWFSKYATTVWNMPLGSANTCLTVATAGAIVSYIPVGNIASKVGRRKTIRFGALLLAACFFAAFLYTVFAKEFSPLLYVLFILVGMAWAAINVNSLPRVVEMCKGSEVGKFTGLYYTFSMAAQIVTPIVAGFLLENVSYHTLFPYAALAVLASFITMGFVRHGDNKVEAKKGLEAFDVGD